MVEGDVQEVVVGVVVGGGPVVTSLVESGEGCDHEVLSPLGKGSRWD